MGHGGMRSQLCTGSAAAAALALGHQSVIFCQLVRTGGVRACVKPPSSSSYKQPARSGPGAMVVVQELTSPPSQHFSKAVQHFCYGPLGQSQSDDRSCSRDLTRPQGQALKGPRAWDPGWEWGGQFTHTHISCNRGTRRTVSQVGWWSPFGGNDRSEQAESLVFRFFIRSWLH